MALLLNVKLGMDPETVKLVTVRVFANKEEVVKFLVTISKVLLIVPQFKRLAVIVSTIMFVGAGLVEEVGRGCTSLVRIMGVNISVCTTMTFSTSIFVARVSRGTHPELIK